MNRHILREIRKVVKYSDYMNYVYNQLDRKIVGVSISKGSYYKESKEIELIISFDRFFLTDLSGDSTNSMSSAQSLLKRFLDANDEDIIFNFQFVEMMKSWGIESRVILRDYSIIDEEYVYSDAAKRYEAGKINDEQYKNIISARQKYIVLG